MRVERINETQMKFVLMTDDLEERDIKISELSYSSDKTQQLFREIMQLVQYEQEFVSGNTPLIFEAMRVGVDSLVIVVTKVNENNANMAMTGNEKNFNLVPAARQKCRFKRLGGLIENLASHAEDSYSVFSFADMDLLTASVIRLPGNFSGESRVYKLEGRYYLVLNNRTEDKRTTAELESVLYEFGRKHVSNSLSHLFVSERAEVIIAESAISKLRAYHEAGQ